MCVSLHIPTSEQSGIATSLSRLACAMLLDLLLHMQQRFTCNVSFENGEFLHSMDVSARNHSGMLKIFCPCTYMYVHMCICMYMY